MSIESNGSILTKKHLQLFTDYTPPSRRFALSAFMLLATVLFSLSAHLPKTDYFHKYRAEAAVYGELEKELSAIPAELSASGASHFYSHLSRRAEIYPTAFEYETDVIAIDLRDSKVPGLYENVLRWIRSDPAYGAPRFSIRTLAGTARADVAVMLFDPNSNNTTPKMEE